MKNRQAILIIDMQKGSFTPKTPRFDRNGVVNRINELARLFRQCRKVIEHYNWVGGI